MPLTPLGSAGTSVHVAIDRKLPEIAARNARIARTTLFG